MSRYSWFNDRTDQLRAAGDESSLGGLISALALKAPLSSPAFTGSPTISGNAVIDSVALAAALGSKADLASPALTGSPTVNGTGIALLAGTTFTNAKLGNAPHSSYTFEAGQDEDGVVSDLSFMRIRTRTSRGSADPTFFYGQTALRVEIEDTTLVVSDATMPYHYGVRVRAVPRQNRHVSGVDDMVGLCVTNGSFSDTGTAFNGTEAIYVGYGGGATGGVSKDWTAGLGVDTVADKGIYIARGPYDYGILITGTITTAAMRIPNGAKVVARNAADSANLDVWKVDTSNNIRLGSGTVHVAVGAPNADSAVSQPLEVHAAGVTDGNLGRSHLRLVDTTAFAANVGGAIGFAGYVDATPNIRTFGAVAARKANGTSGNTAGYLSLYSRVAATGLTEVLRLNELAQLVITEASDIVLGTATGTKIGTATSQRLALFGKTPIVQPTTGVAAAAFVAGSGTTVNDASTFGGYTIKQVVQALQNLGVLA